jgi:hypothetical protein
MASASSAVSTRLTTVISDLPVRDAITTLSAPTPPG